LTFFSGLSHLVSLWNSLATPPPPSLQATCPLPCSTHIVPALVLGLTWQSTTEHVLPHSAGLKPGTRCRGSSLPCGTSSLPWALSHGLVGDYLCCVLVWPLLCVCDLWCLFLFLWGHMMSSKLNYLFRALFPNSHTKVTLGLGL
jgi:hypothetical protein